LYFENFQDIPLGEIVEAFDHKAALEPCGKLSNVLLNVP
jgi:hypothetical protein